MTADLLGPMGTATAESLREVGLEPEPPSPRSPPPRRPTETAPPFPAGLALCGAARAVSTLAGIVLIAASLCGAAASLYRRTVDEPREILRQLAREMETAEDAARRQAMVADEQLREVRAAMRRIEDAQARAVRSERRARRLARNPR